MSAITIHGTQEARDYLEEIAQEMVEIFPITLTEARGRINQQFSGREFVTPISVSNLLHEEQDVWAKHIYYGRDSFWWLDEARLEPQPYAGEK
jgi:hypothetical protein